MPTEIKNPRGGARPGAGRKGLQEETKIVTMRLPVADLDAIQALGVGINPFYREAAKEKLLRDKEV
jgi:hypothetical protein